MTQDSHGWTHQELEGVNLGDTRLNPTYAVSPDRVGLGVLDAWMWAREPKDADGKRDGIKESTRWLEGYERVAELASELPNTRLVYLADREADIKALMQLADYLGTPADWLIHSTHNRSLYCNEKLWQKVVKTVPVGEIQFVMAARTGQKARTVKQALRVKRVSLHCGLAGNCQCSCRPGCKILGRFFGVWFHLFFSGFLWI